MDFGHCFALHTYKYTQQYRSLPIVYIKIGLTLLSLFLLLPTFFLHLRLPDSTELHQFTTSENTHGTDSTLFKAVARFVDRNGLHYHPDRRQIRIDPRVVLEDHPKLNLNEQSLSPYDRASVAHRTRILTDLGIQTTDILADLLACESTAGLAAIDFRAIDSTGIGKVKEAPARCRPRFASIAFGAIQHHDSCANILERQGPGDTLYVSPSELQRTSSCATVYAVEIADDAFFAHRLYLVKTSSCVWIVARRDVVDGAKS